ncbi:aminopeptidase P family protein [Acinetobacter equi]|uniref:Peptidase M24 n=1 Tax=Acinetobacter equi TaxID=1324350 RepID=A0A0N9W9U2_9GAMM|nr:aminopeptidase P family protein [Acinetobacter equi]ALH94161.1 peptidase M24 [Acinetobacter equi]
MNKHDISKRLTLLREQMSLLQIDVFIAMSADPHMSEYLPDFWKIREWLTGFTGSVGTVVVTQHFAGLWVDGRYWVQAEHQLQNTGFTLQKLTNDESTNHWSWLAEHLNENAQISVNTQTISVQQFAILKHIAQQKNFQIIEDIDLIAKIWNNRPALPQHPIYAMKDGINALSRLEKIEKIREHLIERQINGHFISALDDIAWILNCRGADVEYNPIFLSHLYINQQQIVLFIDSSKIDTTLKTQLEADQIQILEYHQTQEFLSQLRDKQILIDPAKISYFHQQAFSAETKVIEDINPSTLFKAQKHTSEIEHIKTAMQKDGIALCHFFHWLESALKNNESINELTIDEKITAFRAQQEGFIGLSFSTIAGFNENGALPHYRATPESYSEIHGNGLLLIDSGSQYEEGTTDITRVVPIGILSAEQKRDYTLVLKCHIALAQMVFPKGLAAPLLDSIARQHLWKYQLDYRHGTGHGVGFALNVHEGPQVLSYYAPIHAYSKLREGMITSNEPGLYHEGKYGIRIENLVVNRLKENSQTIYGDFLEFETLTLCPIHLDCIERSLLTENEREWLNQYHENVQAKLSPFLQGEVLAWLNHNTRAI